METVPVEKIVSAEDLLHRWGISAADLDQIVRNGGLTVYRLHSKRRNVNGEYNFCERMGKQLPRFSS